MKMEYDPTRDLLYIYFGREDRKAARTITIAPGVMADFDKDGKLIGIEVLDASKVLEHKVGFEVKLTPAVATR